VADGVGIVTENLYPGRFRYVEELQRLGADIRADGHHAVVRGVRQLSGAPVKAPKPKKAKKAKSDSESDAREGKCTSLTAKGTPCKNKAFGGGCTCRVHTAKEGAEAKEPKVKAKRGRKSEPTIQRDPLPSPGIPRL
jgi:hypothetical protein